MILVYGDIMQDEYWWGDVARISPEAPVPVVSVSRQEQRPGAAANVARNCEAMGVKTTLVGLDVAKKIRVIGKNQQITRLDFDSKPAPVAVKATFDAFLAMIPAATVVIVSDYGRGTVGNPSGAIKAAKDAGKIVLVDPKGSDYSKYMGADVVKPNLDEMKAVVGGWENEEQLSAKARQLGMTILLTRGAGGMTLFNGSTHHFASQAREVYDVSGAGDTTIAALAVALCRGLTLEESIPYANKAAGIVVGRFGTAVATEAEVFN